LKKRAWLIFLLLVAALFILSSIPGLRVLPVLSFFYSLITRVDWGFVYFARWLASRIPSDLGELYYFDAITRDFLFYARRNPVIIEFFLRKTAHVVVFFTITVALFYLLHQYIRDSYRALLIAAAGGVILSILDEIRQSFVEGRHGSIFDVMVNMAGVGLAALMILFALFIATSGREKFAGRH